MGSIQSISLPSGTTCRPCECQKKCYARKIERLRPSVARSYKKNLDVLNSDPDTYWREVEGTIMMSRYFRFHVSGDIPDAAYFNKMVEISERNTHCQILCFTKKYDIVNAFIKGGGRIPNNLHMIFSAWVNLEMVNPFSLPTAHVRYRDGSTTAKIGAKDCGGNCTECAVVSDGCWTLRGGEEIVFDEH